MNNTVPRLFATRQVFLNETPTKDPSSADGKIGSAISPLGLGLALELGILAVVLGNLLVLLSLKFQDKWRTTDFFLFSLSLADVIGGLIPLQIVIFMNYFLRTAWSKVLCDFYVSFVNTCRFASAGTVTLIAVERAVMLTRPFLYHTSVTRSRARKIVVITWLLSIVISVLPFTGFGKSGFKDGICFYHLSNLGVEYTAFALSLSLLLLVTVLICSVAVKFTSVQFVQRQSRMQPVSINPGVSNANVDGGKKANPRDRRQSIPRGVKDVQRLASMMAVVVLLYYVSWLPILIGNSVALITRTRLSQVTVLVTGMISLIYALANPAVYAKMSPRYWAGYKCVVRKFKEKVGLKVEALRRMSAVSDVTQNSYILPIATKPTNTTEVCTRTTAQINHGYLSTGYHPMDTPEQSVTTTEDMPLEHKTVDQDSQATRSEDIHEEKYFDTKL